jgi:enoyl-CoA hydratase/carnithine racemase
VTELTRADVARDLTFTWRVVSGTEALALGLATRVSDDPLQQAFAMARQVAASNPDAVRAAKRLLNIASPVDARRVLLAEAFEQQRLIGSANQREASCPRWKGGRRCFADLRATMTHRIVRTRCV